ncbi:hypothetical protein [Saccharopolyspora gloriosae]|uniref:hypothetical protein n=1 Tax=Saccharopolyspora gloriosae TaxID=455344 RepID=UPI001FB852C2|nr:hypothetical protein [Saccharopolyspora gloriosae]
MAAIWNKRGVVLLPQSEGWEPTTGADEPALMPAPDRRPRKDRRFMLAAGLGGIGLIITPPALLGLLPAARPADENTAADPYLSREPGGPVHSDEQNRLVVLTRGHDHAVYRNHQQSTRDGAAGDWLSLGGSTVGQPISVTDGNHRLAAFMIDESGTLRYAEQIAPSAGAGTGWRSLSGDELIGTPTASQDSRGLLVVAARDRAGSLWETRQDGAGGWSDLRRLDGAAVRDDPVLRLNRHDELALFALGADGRMRVHTEPAAGSGRWRRPIDLPEAVETSPAVLIDQQKRRRLYSLHADGSMRENVETGAASGEWRGWREFGLGGPFESRPVTVSDGNGIPVVLARRTDGSVWERFQHNRREDRWSLWKSLDGELTELVGAAQDANGIVVVFGIGQNGRMTRNYQVKDQVRPWADWHPDFGGEFPPQHTS